MACCITLAYVTFGSNYFLVLRCLDERKQSHPLKVTILFFCLERKNLSWWIWFKHAKVYSYYFHSMIWWTWWSSLIWMNGSVLLYYFGYWLEPHYCSNQCWAVLNLGICPLTSQLSTFSNHQLWYITMVCDKKLIVKESWVLSWKSLVLSGFWNNQNWPFIYSKFFSKNWNWRFIGFAIFKELELVVL